MKEKTFYVICRKGDSTYQKNVKADKILPSEKGISLYKGNDIVAFYPHDSLIGIHLISDDSDKS